MLHELSTMLLSHHPPEEYDRCTWVAGQPVCRRCLALYPLTVAVLLLQRTPAAFDSSLAPLLAGLAVPATLDFVLERLGVIQYHPSRVVVGSVMLAFPLGYGLSRYLVRPFDPWFWGLVLVFGVPSVAAALWRGWKDHRPDR